MGCTKGSISMHTYFMIKIYHCKLHDKEILGKIYRVWMVRCIDEGFNQAVNIPIYVIFL